VARRNYECSDCQNKFTVNYIFFKPDLKCPACGSHKIKEESAGGGGCCGKASDKPARFT